MRSDAMSVLLGVLAVVIGRAAFGSSPALLNDWNKGA